VNKSARIETRLLVKSTTWYAATEAIYDSLSQSSCVADPNNCITSAVMPVYHFEHPNIL